MHAYLLVYDVNSSFGRADVKLYMKLLWIFDHQCLCLKMLKVYHLT